MSSSHNGLRIAHLSISNVLGIEALELDAGQLTMLEGGTGAGKSSVLEAIKAAVEGKGLRPKLVREQAEEGRVVLLLSDGTEINQRFSADGKARPPTVTQGRARISSPRDYLRSLLSPYQLDPVAFLGKPAREQAQELLALVEVQVAEEQWRAWSGGELLAGVAYSDHPLAVLAALEAALMEQRRGRNAAAKQSEAIAADHAAHVPAGFDAEAVRGVNLRERVERLAEARAHNEARERLERALEAKRAEIDRLKADLSFLRGEADGMACNLAEQEPVDLAPLEESVAAHEEQRETLAHYDAAQAAREEGLEQRVHAERLTTLIEGVRAQPAELLAGAALPVEGMGVGADGRLTIHGRDLGQLSDGEKLSLALQVAAAQAGEARFLCADGLERLDSEAQEEFIRQAHAHGLQLFATRVTAGPLVASTEVA